MASPFNLKSLEYENVVLFKHAFLKLNEPGVTSIRGRNLNARTKDQSNGTGKSLLAGGIPDILLKQPPLATKKNDRKSSMSDPDSKIILVGERDGVEYTLQKAAHGKSVKYTVLKNGKDTKVRTTAIAEEFIQELHGWSETEFYTTVYLEGRRPFFFQMGTDSQRLEFFTSLFRLEGYDDVRDKLNKRKADLRDDQTKLGVVEADLVKAERDLEQSNWKPSMREPYLALIEERTELKRKHQRISDRVTSLSGLQALFERSRVLNEQHQKLSNKIGDNTFENVQKQRDLIEQNRHYESSLHEYNRRRKKLQSRLATYEAPKEDAQDLHTKLRSVEKLIARLEERIDGIKARREAITTALKGVRKSWQDTAKRASKKAKGSRADLETKRAELTTIIKLGKLASKGHTECPTCGSPIEQKQVKSRAAKAAASITKIDEQIEGIEAALKLERIEAEGLKLREELDSGKLAKLEKHEAEFKDLVAQRRNISTLLDAATAVSDLKAQLKALKAPAKPDGKPTMERATVDKLLSAFQQRRTLLPELKRVKAEIEEAGGRDLNESDLKKLPKLLKTQRKGNERLHKLAQTLSEQRSQFEAYKAIRSRIKELTKKRKRFRKALRDLPIIEALIHAYSNKGLKVMATQRLAAIIESNMNRLADLTFVEKTKFTINVTAGAFSVLYHRGKRVADVRKLSGAESRSFALLFLVALLPLIPAERRCNCVILDEMDANMSDPSKRLLAQDFLPYLNSLVPTVINITPDNRTPYPGKVIFVEKKGRYSKLV